MEHCKLPYYCLIGLSKFPNFKAMRTNPELLDDELHNILLLHR
jgi:hypothetical protein